MTAYYNEFDKYAARWLQNLIAAGLIAPGIVDDRSIEDVTPNDIKGFTQCHFFAGVGVWSLALRNAGWDDNRHVWTASCPCQPFSAAGAGAGFDDERHLWPALQHLIAERKPAIILGEQVASGIAASWVDLIHADLEAMGYAFGCVPFPSAGVGAPHIRDRNYWMADAIGSGSSKFGRGRFQPSGLAEGCAFVRLDESSRTGLEGLPKGGDDDGENAGRFEGIDGPPRCDQVSVSRTERAGPTNGFWRDADWLGCRDGKWRAVEPGTFPLAHGAASRVGRLRAYGNAINAEAARVFIQSAMSVLD